MFWCDKGYKRFLALGDQKTYYLRDKESNNIKEESNANTVKIFIDSKFSGNTGERIVKNCIKKLYKYFKKEVNIKFMLHYQTTKLSHFTSTKDKTPFLNQSSVCLFAEDVNHVMLVKQIARYMRGQRNTPASKGNKNEQSAVCEHLSLCTHYSYIAVLSKIDTNSFNSNQFHIFQIRDNTIILDRGNNWNVSLFKEAPMIKKQAKVKLRLNDL